MQKKTIILLIIVAVVFGLCLCTILLGLGAALLYRRATTVSSTEVWTGVVTAAIQETEQGSVPPISPTVPSQSLTPSPVPTLPTPEPPPNVDFNGIRFYLDTNLAQGVLPELVPEAEGDASNSLPGSVYPEYTQFTLQGYSIKDSDHAPRLYVYPLITYRSMDRSAGEMADLLNRLLGERPLTADQLPFLPFWNAASLFRSNLSYVDFKNGSGVRYLTQFAQDVSPIYNTALFYTFQGITTDQEWYIAAVLPVHHPSLPDNAEETEWEIDAPHLYYAKIQDQLSAEADESFVPSLSLLDALIASLRVR